MPNFLELLDGYFFTGITGNVAYDVLKNAWHRVTRRSWETLYLDAFEAAVKDVRPRLTAYAEADGEIAINRDELIRALHSDVQVGPRLARLSDLSDVEFIAALADAMAERSVLTIGGNTLSKEGYTQVNRNLVATATQYFRQFVLADDEAFRQALLTETQHNTALVEEVLHSLTAQSGVVLDQLEHIGADVAIIKQQMPTFAQVNKVFQEVEALSGLLQTGLASDAELRQQLATERERRWNDRFEYLRRTVDDGYSAAVRDEVVALIDELDQHLHAGESISSELQGSIYRLGAIAFQPSRSSGDVSRARTYLRRARPHSSGDAAVKCEIIEAVLVNITQGIGPALDLLAGLEGDEPQRLRFSLALQHEDIVACEQMIADGQVNLDQATTNPLWARPIMFYYSATGPREGLLASIDTLISVGRTADHLEAAALALTRSAFAAFGRFCRDHQVFPEFHYALDLEELIDAELRERAIRYFENAAETYLQRHCHADGMRALVSAIRLLMDLPEGEWRSRLLDRLRELAPTHPLLAASGVSSDIANGMDALEQLERMFAEPETDVLLLLHRARQVARGPVGPRQVADLLLRQEAHFQFSPLVQLQFEIGVLEFLQEAGDEAEVEAWLTRISSPALYEHMRPLCFVTYYLPRNKEAARQWVEQARAVAPNQPEVLLATAVVLQQTGEYTVALDAAQRLFALLRTRQTARLYLDLLHSARRFHDLLNLLEQTSNLGLAEVDRRAYQAVALVALGQALQAVTDLEWLVDQGQASVSAMLSLAQIYLRLHRHADAVFILRRCIERHTDNPDSRLLLSNVLLAQGQHDESFRIAVQAREQFPDDPSVALHLVQLAFSAGHEDAPEVQAAFQALTPGGALSDSALVRLADVEDAREMLVASMNVAQEADHLYSQGQIPLLLRCYFTQWPLCWYHCLVQERHAIQFVAPWIGSNYPGWWESPRLPTIVIDYTALLSLWALFGNTLLTLLQASAERIYVPTSLLDILAWERANLAAQGQRALEQTRTQVQAMLTQRVGRLKLHSPPADAEGSETIGAAALSTELHLVYITAYLPPGSVLNVPALDLPALADDLLRAGEISPNVARNLREHTTPVVVERSPVLLRGAAIVTNTLTLIAIQQAGALDALLSYCDQIHLLERDWEELCSQVTGVVLRERALRNLDQLQALVAQAVSNQYFHAEVIPPDQGLFRVPAADEDGEHSQLHHLALAYINDLFSLAHRYQAPLWTDDRWTALVGLPEHRAIDRVSTDTMLRWLYYHDILDEQQVHSAHSDLVRWGYQGLSINSDYLCWLARQGVQAEARLLINAATLYRSSLIGLWTMIGANSTSGKEHYLAYLLAFAETMMSYFSEGAKVEVAATVIRHLDVSTVWTELFGKEPAHLSDVLLRLIGLIYRDNFAEIGLRQLSRFSDWLAVALQQAQLGQLAIDEAWRLTVENILRIYEEFIVEHGHVAGADLLLRLAVRIMPEHSLDWVLVSRLGNRVRDYIGDMLRPEIVWTIQRPDGTTFQLAYPRQQWDRDYARAFDQAVIQTNTAPIIAGVITLAQLQDRPSLWLRFNLLPTEQPELLNEPGATRPDRVVELFSRFVDPRRLQRQAVWHIGRRLLTALSLPTHVWDQLRPQLLNNRARTWRPAGHTALRIMFGQWKFIRATLDEALELGPRALFDVLTRLRPDDVRAWLGLSSRLDTAALRRWAEQTAASVSLGEDAASATRHLTDYVVQFGHSFFSDTLILRARVVELIASLPELQQRTALLQRLLQQAQESTSRALKANSVLIVLEYRSKMSPDPDSDSDLDAMLVEIVMEVAAPQNPNDPQTAPIRLIAQLARYFYQAWRSNVQTPATDLAYLAHMAASWIGEAIASCLSNEAIEQVNDALSEDTLRADFRPVRQPLSLFRPAWAGLMNYGVALLLGASPTLRQALAALVETTPARNTLLRCGAQHQILHQLLNVAAIQPGWLDDACASDIPASIADLFAYLDEATLSAWPQEEIYMLVICGIPEAGLMLLTSAIERLPEQANDDEVINTVSMAFLGLEELGGESERLVQHLLAPSQLARIQSSSDCYNLLAWRATGVLTNPSGYQEGLITAIRSALHTIPDEPAVASDVVTTITGVLAHRVSVGQLLDEMRDWLIYLAASEKTPPAIVRSVLGMLLHWWPKLSKGSRAALRPAIDALANVPHLPVMWELVRLRESD